MSKVCQRDGCKNGVHNSICPCFHTRRTGGSAGGLRGGQGGPAVSGGSGGGGVHPPSTSVKKAQLKSQAIPINQCYLGKSLNVTQWMELVSPDGRVYPVQSLYDNACDNTHIEVKLQDYSWEEIREINYNLKTLTDSVLKKGHIGKFIVRSRFDHSRQIQFDALTEDLSNTVTERHDVLVPEHWTQKYGIGPVCSTAHGQISIVFGNDICEYEPEVLERCGKLKLMRSVLDGEILLGGAIAQDQLLPSEAATLTAEPHIRVQRTHVEGRQRT